MKKKKSTQNEEILGQLEELAGNLDISVRYEKIQKESAFFPGGYCKVKGKDLIIINSKASLDDKVEIISRALLLFDLSQIYVLPAVRELIDSYSKN
ncbi:MAG: hypothetical protein JXL81_09385 [Deltaproteobacteria bacterium]|nr:hypothetical protein [Deltaproteobacteria bacterium]